MRLATIAWRGLLARPLRTALAIVGIALGVAVVTATIITGSSSEQALRSATADLLGRADLRLRAFDDAGFRPRTIQALRALPNVEAVAPVSERRLTVSTTPGDNERVFTLLVMGIDPEADALVRDPRLDSGVPLSADSPTDVLAPASWVSRNGLELGDQLLLAGRREGMPPLRIIGLMADTGLAARENGDLLILSRTTLDESFGVPAPIRYLDLDLGDEPDEAAIERVTATLDEPFVVETEADAAAPLASAQEGFVGVALLFGLVSL
nr:ABC transporter permease [Chloroflexota bacterium]